MGINQKALPLTHSVNSAKDNNFGCTFFLFFFSIEVSLIYNVVFVSGVRQNDLVFYIYTATSTTQFHITVFSRAHNKILLNKILISF